MLWWGATVVRGDSRTEKMLTDESRRPPVARSPIDPALLEAELEEPFNLDVDLLQARRGVAAGQSGMTAEHSKPLLGDTTSTRLFGDVAGQFVRGAMPEEVLQACESWPHDSIDDARWRSAGHRGG